MNAKKLLYSVVLQTEGKTSYPSKFLFLDKLQAKEYIKKDMSKRIDEAPDGMYNRRPWQHFSFTYCLTEIDYLDSSKPIFLYTRYINGQIQSTTDWADYYTDDQGQFENHMKNQVRLENYNIDDYLVQIV